jgi:methylmalonyl-CoA mutase N-terminal domain/subunit
VFRLDPQAASRVTERYENVKARRDNAAVERTLTRLQQAAGKDEENLMPYLIDCCHAYATVGEMVQRLKAQWGEFQEPVRL